MATIAARPLPAVCTPTTHSKRQHVEARPDGSRVQVCDRCGHVVAVVQRATGKAA